MINLKKWRVTEMSVALLRRRKALLSIYGKFNGYADVTSPPPIQVGFTKSAGRGVFATRRISAGELIHTAKPVLSHPSLSSLDSVCYFCLTNLQHQPSKLPFCSDECRQQSKIFYETEKQADWSGFHEYCRYFLGTTPRPHYVGIYWVVKVIHQPIEKTYLSPKVLRPKDTVHVEIPLVVPTNIPMSGRLSVQALKIISCKNARTQGLKYPLLVKRLACMIISGAATPETLDILQPAMLSSEMILLMEKEYQLLKSTFKDAGFRDEKIAFLSKRWYVDVLARIRINSFRIELTLGSYEDILLSAAATVEAQSAVGNAVYMLPSFYNHDCDPNAHILWIESVNAKLKALRDIEAGEELRICYIDASMEYDARNVVLYEGFGFHCKCARCMSNG